MNGLSIAAKRLARPAAWPAMALALAGLGAGPGPAHAAVCMQHKSLASYLTDRFAEVPRALGLVAGRSVMEVYVSAAGTWTIVMTTVEGVSCIVAAGDAWRDVKAKLDASQEY